MKNLFKRCAIVLLLMISFASCTYDEIPAGPAVVESVHLRSSANGTDDNERMYRVIVKPAHPLNWMTSRGLWLDPKKYIIYTDSLVSVGDTINILK